MRWFRSHRRLGSRLALFALAVQTVLSFGHVHIDRRAFASASAATTSVEAADRRAPALPDRHTGANDFCAICATVSLIASSLLPGSPSLAPPLASEHRWLNELAGATLASDSSVLFQARAPPTVL